ncbi:MAG: hypothetical protein AAF351_07720 [Pseudomonadota bacterium]
MQRPVFKTTPLGGGPIANALVIVAAAIVIGIAIVLGFFAFVALATLILGGGIFVAVRNWWLRKTGRAQPRPDAAQPTQRPSSDVIEGEFRVVKDDKNS